MRRVLTSAVALATISTGVHAGGIERSTGSLAVLFEEGNYAELSFGSVDPSVSGSFVGTPSGDMAASFTNLGVAYKTALSDQLDLALIIDQPYGVNVDYPSGTGYAFAGSTATVNSTGVTAALRYDLGNQFSVLGGLRAVTTSGEVVVDNTEIGGDYYFMDTSSETDFGYVLGVAYEKPEIALRVGLTYTSEITHDFDADEVATYDTTFSTTLPQSLTLDAQSGIAANTLLFGSVRWVDWSEFDISPTIFDASTGASLVDYDDDVVTYTIGLGRKINDTWSAAVSLSHEAAGGETVGNLGPTDGNTSLGLGATYTKDNMKISGGLRYVWIGDAETVIRTGFPNSEFTDNTALGLGFKVGFSF